MVVFLLRCEVVCVCVFMCVCECVHTHLCACAKTTRRGSRRNGPFYLFTQLSAGDFAVGVAFPLILRRARFRLSCTKAYPSAWSWNSSAVIQEGPEDRPPGPGCFLEPGREGWKLESILAPCWPLELPDVNLTFSLVRDFKIPEVLWPGVPLFAQVDP